MRFPLILLPAIGMLFILAACGTTERHRNLHNLADMRKGMHKDEVLRIMGEPLTNERYNQPDIWYYYTQQRWADGSITRDECTPLVFENDRLIGWGQEFYREYSYEKW